MAMGARRARSAMLTIVRLMKTPADVTGPINIGNPNEFTMLGLAEMIMELMNSRSKIVYRPLPQDDPKQRRPDISRASTELGWSPRVGLREPRSEHGASRADGMLPATPLRR